MEALLRSRTPVFQGLGDSLLTPTARGEVQRHAIPNTLQESRVLLHDHCPLTPGVYAWLDSRQQICYIGKSKSLRTRLLTYFAKNPTDPKARRIREHGLTLVWEPLTSELLSLIREQELIYRWRPEFNTQGQPTKRQPGFLCFSKGPAANAFFARRFSAKADFVFGPIAGTGRLRSATEAINQAFRLRDCPDKTKFEFNNQKSLFENPKTAGCIRFELGSCPAPCAGLCSQSDYQANVERAQSFVKGSDTDILKKLRLEMSKAAESMQFERAAVLRDQYKHLAWLDRRLKALRTAKRKFNGVLTIPTVADGSAWLILRRGRILGSLAMPKTDLDAIAAIKQLNAIANNREQLPETILEMHLQLIMISWFRKHPKSKKSLVTFGDAIETCNRLLSP